MRCTLPHNRKYLASLSTTSTGYLAYLIGGLSYRSRSLVHRLDLRLPPAVGPEVLTVHDLAPLRFSDEGTLPRSAIQSARRARFVICPSEFAASEVRELLGVERAVVIHNGVTIMGLRPPAPLNREQLARVGITGPYVLHAGGASSRKNLEALSEAWRVVAPQIPEIQLALCGGPDERRTALFGNLMRTRLLGRIEPSHLVHQLMAGASAVIVPSLYEGFGLPALEAMACAAPVVAAAAGSLPEVCGDAALLVPPDTGGLAAGLRRVLTEAPLADRLRVLGPLRAAEFTWTDAAGRHLEVYERAVAS
jgi:glycosyltransferase involved in cell wall biosynthesis